MIFSAIGKGTEKFIVDNCPAILTGVGVIGTIATAVLAAKGGIKSGKDIDNELTLRIVESNPNGDSFPLTAKETIKLTWKNYIPAAGVGTLTVTSIVMAQRMNMKRAAALAAAYAISEKKFGEYKDKVVETLGIKKEEAVRAEIAQTQVTNNPPAQIIIADGEVLFLDSQSGRYFQSTVEKIKQAQNDINYEMLRNNYCSLSEFYDKIGLSSTTFSDEVGWNSDHLVEIAFSAAITPDSKKPCLVLEYHVSPTRGYCAQR